MIIPISKKNFGEEVANNVIQVSEDMNIPNWKERKQKYPTNRVSG